MTTVFYSVPAPNAARTYDSGLVAPIRTVVRQAVIEKLQPLLIANGGFLEAIDGIGYAVTAHDLDSLDLLMADLIGRSPAIAVEVGDMVLSPAGAPGTGRGTLEVNLYVVTTHLRGASDGRVEADVAGTTVPSADPGIDVALECAWQLLESVNLGRGTKIKEPHLQRETELITDQQVTIWHQVWHVGVSRDVNLHRDVTQLLTSFRSTLRTSTAPAGPTIVEITTP
jgi:hypothetical protein